MKHFKSSTTGKTYTFYDSAKEIPISRWNKFITSCIESSELGLSFESCVDKLGLLDEYLTKQDREAFTNARTNLQIQLYYIYKGINPFSIALSKLLVSVDGKKADVNDTDLYKQLEEDESITLGLVEDLVTSIRKK